MRCYKHLLKNLGTKSTNQSVHLKSVFIPVHVSTVKSSLPGNTGNGYEMYNMAL